MNAADRPLETVTEIAFARPVALPASPWPVFFVASIAVFLVSIDGIPSEVDETAYQATLAGAGLAQLPELASTARPDGGQLHRVLPPWVSADALRLVAAMPSRLPADEATRLLRVPGRHVRQVAARAGCEQPLSLLHIAPSDSCHLVEQRRRRT